MFQSLRLATFREVIESIGCIEFIIFVMSKDRRVESIERNKVRYFTLVSIDEHGMNYAIFRQEEVSHLFLREGDMHFVIVVKMLVESYGDFWYIFGLHLSDTWGVHLCRQFMHLDKGRHWLTCGLKCKSYIYKFSRVKVAMPILS